MFCPLMAPLVYKISKKKVIYLKTNIIKIANLRECWNLCLKIAIGNSEQFTKVLGFFISSWISRNDYFVTQHKVTTHNLRNTDLRNKIQTKYFWRPNLLSISIVDHSIYLHWTPLTHCDYICICMFNLT